eukprot:333815_1
MFCLRLMDATQWLLFTISIIFIFLPWIMNLVQLFEAQKKWVTDSSIQEGVRGWFMNWNLVLILACAISGNSFGSIELANSNLFGIELFSMGLPSHALKEFQSKRFYSSVLLENVPQLAVQIYFLTLLKAFDEPTFVALLSSSISVVLSVVDIWSAQRLLSVMDKAKNDDSVDINKIEFLLRSNIEIDERKHILVNRPHALAKAIAETLTVDRRNIEIYQLLAGSRGLKVGFTCYSIDYNCDQMCADLINKRLALQYLIANHWNLKQFPRIKDIAKSQATNEQIMLQIADQIKASRQKKMTQGSAQFTGIMTPDPGEGTGGRTSTGSTLAPPKRGHGKTISTIKLIPLGELNKTNMDWVRSMDPQLMALKTLDEDENEDDEGEDAVADMAVLPSIEEETKWKEYMDNLHKYALGQKKIYESNPISQNKPLHILTQEEVNDDRDTLWTQYTDKIGLLLDERSKMIAAVKAKTPSMSDKETPKFMLQISNLDEEEEESKAQDNLHQRVQSVIRSHLNRFSSKNEMEKALLSEFDTDENLNVFELFDHENDKCYEIVIDAPPLDIEFKSDDHEHNTMVTGIGDTRRSACDSAGIEKGMILSEMNGANVLGMAHTTIKQKVDYPLRLVFMSETNVIRFDYVESAASLMRYSLHRPYSKVNIIKFLAKQGMTWLEVRSATCLVNEHGDLLPPVQQCLTPRRTPTARDKERVGMTGNRLLSLFLESSFAQFELSTHSLHVYTPPIMTGSPRSPRSPRSLSRSRSPRGNTYASTIDRDVESMDKTVVETIFGLGNLTAVDVESFHREVSKQSQKMMTPLTVEEKDLISEIMFMDVDDDEEDDVEIMPGKMSKMSPRFKRPKRPKRFIDIELSAMKPNNESAITPMLTPKSTTSTNKGKSTPIQKISKNVTELVMKAAASSPKRPQRPKRPRARPTPKRKIQRPKRPVHPRLRSPPSPEHVASMFPRSPASTGSKGSKSSKPIVLSPPSTSPRRSRLQVHVEPHTRTKSGNLLGVNVADVMDTVKKRVSILFAPKPETNHKQLKSIMDVPNLSYIAWKSSEHTDPEEEKMIKIQLPKKNPLKIGVKSASLGIEDEVDNQDDDDLVMDMEWEAKDIDILQSEAVAPRHSQLVTQSNIAHMFLSQLQLVKMNSKDATDLPDDCYCPQHFAKTMEEDGIQLTEEETEQIMQEIIDIEMTIEYGETLFSEASFNEFVQRGAQSRSLTAKKFWTLLAGCNSSK